MGAPLTDGVVDGTTVGVAFGMVVGAADGADVGAGVADGATETIGVGVPGGIDSEGAAPPIAIVAGEALDNTFSLA